MKSISGKMLVLAAVLMLAVAPAVADEHNETQRSDTTDMQDNETQEDGDNETDTHEKELSKVVKRSVNGSEHADERSIQARIEAKQKKIRLYRERIKGLEEEIEQLKKERTDAGETPEGNRTEPATNTTDEAEKNASESEEQTEESRNSSDDSAENVNGTSGGEKAGENRPGFVSRMLSGFFR